MEWVEPMQTNSWIRCLLGTMIITGCTASTPINDSLIGRLNNRGPVALSSENPYLAANLLISREMESEELRGFIKHRGAPAALEVEKKSFNPLILHFYYPENQEYFDLEQIEDGWMIRGPFHIPHDKYKEVSLATRGIRGNPKLVLPKQSDTPWRDNVNYLEPQDVASQVHGGKLHAKLKEDQSSYTETERLNAPIEPRFEHEAATTLKHPAELTPRGDVVHYVTLPGETLSMISRWYTQDRSNAGRIARINKLNNPDDLKIGDMIIVPSYLVKNKSRLTEEAAKALMIIAAEER